MTITLYDFDLLRSGLHISYNDQDIDLDPDQTGELLMQCGLISDYKNYDGVIVVWFKYENDGGIKTAYEEWNDYVMFTVLTESIAKILVKKHIENRLKIAA